MCGDPATTGEHKVKRTDLERVHGRADAFRSANLNYLRSDASVVPLQGPNSKHVKYHRVLCGPCNSTRSQPFDHAYDTFAQYVEDRSDVLLSRRQIDFASVYGNGWREGQVNLFKYFVKALGCRIADAGKSVPNDLINFFKDRYPEKPLAICFSVHEDEIVKPKHQQTRLGIGHLVHSEGSGAEIRFASAGRYRWLLISYWYNWGPYGPMGEPWHRDQQFLCLGSYTAAESKVDIRREDGTFTHWSGIEA